MALPLLYEIANFIVFHQFLEMLRVQLCLLALRGG